MGGSEAETRGGTRRARGMLVAALLALLASAGCGEFLLRASDLDIGPNPAEPGELMVATVLVNLIPTQQHTIFFFVNGEEYLRVNSNQQPPVPVILELGDAADMIAAFGAGTHTAHVVVQAEDKGESARTESVIFQLIDTGS